MQSFAPCYKGQQGACCRLPEPLDGRAAQNTVTMVALEAEGRR